MRTSDFCPGDLRDANGPPEPNQDLTGSPSRARPKKARGMASGKRPAREQEGGDQEKQNAPCHAHADGKLLRIRRSEQAGAENENEESR